MARRGDPTATDVASATRPRHAPAPEQRMGAPMVVYLVVLSLLALALAALLIRNTYHLF